MESINYPYLILAVILLWMPRQWFRAGRKTARGLGLRSSGPSRRLRESGDQRINPTEEFSKPRNYVDFLRAFTGALILVGMPEWGVASCFGATEIGPRSTGNTPLLMAQLALILVGTTIQFIRRERRLTFYAPLFYLTGLLYALCGPGPATVSFLLIWVFNAALPETPATFLSVYSLIALVMGLLFRGVGDVFVYAAVILMMLPVVVSLLTGHSLALFNKKRR